MEPTKTESTRWVDPTNAASTRGRLDRRIERYGWWLIRHRWLVLAVVLILTVTAGWGAQYLRFATNYRVFFGPDNPELNTFEAVQNIYTKNDNIMFVLAPADGEVFSQSTLAAVEELTENAWQIPASIRVDSVTNFQHSRAEADDLIVEDLVFGAEDLTAGEIEEVREIALGRPELLNRLISPAADVTGVNVTLQLDNKDPLELLAPVSMARELAADVELRYPDIDVRLTGVSMLNNAFMEVGMGDMKKLIPIMYGVLILAMVVLLRSTSGTVATFLVIGFSSVAALGIAGWSRLLLEPVSGLAPTMILTMAIADSIHILVSFFSEMRAGRAKNDALVESLRLNFVPVLLTSLTTAIGFLSMNFSDSPPLNRLGTITAVGVVVAFALSITFLPALMSILPVKVRAQNRRPTGIVFERLGGWVTTHHRRLLVSAVVAVIAVVAFLPANDLNDQFVRYFDESVEFRRDTDFAMERLSGIYQAQFSLPAGTSGGISEPEYLERLDAFSSWLREQPNVVQVSTLSDTLRRLNMNMHGDDPAYYRLPENRELAAQYLLLFEMSLPYGLDLNNQINVDKSSTRVIAMIGDVPTKEYLQLTQSAEQWLEENAPPSMRANATGPSVMFSRITERNIRSMIVGTGLAFLLISAILTFALRSWRLGLLSLVPNMVPATMAFGAWGVLVGRVGFAVSVVAAMTMGIVVDDTVHFLTKYLRARREKGLDAAGAVRYAFSSVGQALWVTSAVLITGFLVLSQSAFQQNSEMGLLAAVTISFALLADFFLLPTLLIVLDRGARQPARQIQSNTTEETLAQAA
jgi:predicted RND superfamily exporter protein